MALRALRTLDRITRFCSNKAFNCSSFSGLIPSLRAIFGDLDEQRDNGRSAGWKAVGGRRLNSELAAMGSSL